MDINPLFSKRRVIPRWRNFRTTLETGELSSFGSQKPILASSDPVFLSRKLEQWNETKDLSSAIELVGAALVSRQEDKAIPAAEFILRNEGKVPKSILNIARVVLNNEESDKNENKVLAANRDVIVREQISNLKKLLIEYPKNSFLWVDLARAYSILGQNNHAVRAIEGALSLNPNNRFVLRCAARLFVHIEDADRAHDLLKNSVKVIKDPWLMASEISTASIIGKNSNNINAARKLIKQGLFSPFEITELAGALGTVSLFDGGIKDSRKLFRLSLVQPTENTVAQAHWAEKYVSDIEIRPELLSLPMSFETCTRNEINSGNIEEGLKHCKLWLEDEPYSSNPAISGSFYAASVLEEYQLGEYFAVTGLMANPNDPVLLNNMAVIRAYQGDLKEARNIFNTIPKNKYGIDFDCTLKATEGLFLFREGNVEAGRQKYNEALDLAKKEKRPVVRALAALHLAREEEKLSPENSIRAIKVALDEIKVKDDKAVKIMLDTMYKQYKNSQMEYATEIVNLLDNKRLK